MIPREGSYSISVKDLHYVSIVCACCIFESVESYDKKANLMPGSSLSEKKPQHFTSNRRNGGPNSSFLPSAMSELPNVSYHQKYAILLTLENDMNGGGFSC